MTDDNVFHPVVCKPCWELNYCPYGPLVEQFPLPIEDPEIDITQVHTEVVENLTTGQAEQGWLYSEVERFLFSLPVRWEAIEDMAIDEVRCKVFGHVCPVFLMAEPFTETRVTRPLPSRHIPRGVLLRVVRRDGRMCQLCRKSLGDNEIEIDHIIPISKGGPTRASNLRVLCRECNRGKSDSMEEILAE